jgi:hypothetical protein
LDGIFVIDMYVSFVGAYYDRENKVVDDFWKIAVNYLTCKKQFLLIKVKRKRY